ncbi:MAG: hypothetical protein AAF125_11600 [Chloroflexota bacterium]
MSEERRNKLKLHAAYLLAEEGHFGLANEVGLTVSDNSAEDFLERIAPKVVASGSGAGGNVLASLSTAVWGTFVGLLLLTAVLSGLLGSAVGRERVVEVEVPVMVPATNSVPTLPSVDVVRTDEALVSQLNVTLTPMPGLVQTQQAVSNMADQLMVTRAAEGTRNAQFVTLTAVAADAGGG